MVEVADLSVAPITFSVTAATPTVPVTTSSGALADLTVAPITFSVNASAPTSAVKGSSGATVILVPVPGGVGATGPAGNGAQVFGELLNGTVDGANESFTTDNPFITGSTSVFINGVRERLNIGYSETASTSITFSEPPFVGAELVIDYLIQ